MAASENPARPVGGRPRDATRDAALLDATLDMLAEVGFERLTIDAVAARAGAGKATVYRRWPSKAHLVVDAITRLGAREVDVAQLPDTGTLRGDLVGLIRPEALDDSNRELKLMAAVAAMHASVDEPELTHVASSASVRPWVTANRLLLERALERGDITVDIDLDLASRMLPALCVFRDSIEQTPLTSEFITRAIDQLLLPALGVPPAG